MLGHKEFETSFIYMELDEDVLREDQRAHERLILRAQPSVAPVLLATLPPARGTYAEASVPDISRYQWLYVLGLGEELPTLLVPVPVFRAAPGRRFHSTLPAGNATGYEANIEYVSDTKIKYRVGTYITSMDIYGIGRA